MSCKNETKGVQIEEEEEPILMEQPQKFCMFPIKYPQLWEMYKRAQASFWAGFLSIYLYICRWIFIKICVRFLFCVANGYVVHAYVL